MRAAVALACLLLASPVHAGDWFQHRFGEARAYHGDWLAVCADKGAGACRAVQLQAREDAPGGGARRLAIAVDAPGRYAITLFHRTMPTPPPQPLVFEIGRDVYRLEPGTWKVGERTLDNVLETITVTDTTVARTLVDAMKGGNTMRFAYGGAGSNGSRAGARAPSFSLRGVTAALDAIEARLRARSG